MNMMIATLLLAASAQSDMELSVREAANSEMATISVEAQRQLAKEMAGEVRAQLAERIEERVAEALLPMERQLLAAEPTKKK